MSGILAALAGIKTAIATAVDEYFNRVTLLLNTSSTNGAQNNTFLDSSTNNFTITRNGNTTQGTFTPFSQTGWSNYFNGSGDYLSTSTSNSSMVFGTAAYTIEGWIFQTARSGTQWIIGGGGGFQLGINSTGNIFGSISGVGDLTAATTAIALNTLTHFAVVRNTTSSGGVAYYINGVAAGTATDATNYTTNVTLNIATTNGNAGVTPFSGYLSNIRVVKGTAVYTSGFTPSTTPLTAISGTSVLTCQSNRFIDNSSNAYTITVNGTPSVQAFSPFAPTAAYDTAVVGGSGYFDGSGDYLSVPNNAALQLTAASAFTIEAWVYPTSIPSDNGIIGKRGSGVEWQFFFKSDKTLHLYNGTTDYGSGTAISGLNQWVHAAVTWDLTTLRFFLNGVLCSSTYTGISLTSSTNDVTIGSDYANAELWNGYLSSVRLVKGSALYTSTFTPPTAPLTAVTNTSLLTNFTNAGIYDSTSKNVLETVGNAQVSTTQAKWGTTSMAFDGTGDYLTIPNSPTLAVGSGDFTIEGWWYPTDLSGTTNLWCLGDERSSYNGLLLYWSGGTSKLTLYSNGSAIITSSISTSTNTWYFVSVVRSGTTITLYVNGSSAGTVTNSTSFTGIAANGFCLNAEYAGSFTAGKAAYYDDFRITKGYARPSTSPTAAFPLQQVTYVF